MILSPPHPNYQQLAARRIAAMPVSATPSTDLTSLGDNIYDYLTQHRFTFPNRPTVTTVDPSQLRQGVAGVYREPGATASPDGSIRVSPAYAQLGPTGQTAEMLLHEMLHETATGGSNLGNVSPEQALATEQATETMAQDLYPGMMHYARVNPHSGWQMEYKPQVVAERLASGQATGTNWTSPAARAWRAGQFFTPAAQRMLVRFQPNANPA